MIDLVGRTYNTLSLALLTQGIASKFPLRYPAPTGRIVKFSATLPAWRLSEFCESLGFMEVTPCPPDEFVTPSLSTKPKLGQHRPPT